MRELKGQAGDIEITEEMTEAGATALAEFDDRFESLEDGARRIFVAMLAVRASHGRAG